MNINTTLEDIHFKYERLTSLISLLQVVAAELIDVAGVPGDSYSNALYEVEIGMIETNEKLKDVMDAIHHEKPQPFGGG